LFVLQLKSGPIHRGKTR